MRQKKQQPTTKKKTFLKNVFISWAYAASVIRSNCEQLANQIDDDADLHTRFVILYAIDQDI